MELYGHQQGSTPKGVSTTEREITTDRTCIACGYNLRGLMTGGQCPECGEQIRFVRTGSDRLGESSMLYLNLLAAGFFFMGVGLGTLTLFALASPFTSVGVFASFVALGGLMWLFGLGVVLMPRARTKPDLTTPEEQRTWNVLRACIIGTQLSAAGGAVVAALFGSSTTGGTIAAVLLSVWMVGFVPIGLYCALLAQWAEDDSLTNRWRGGGWMVGLPGGLWALLGILDLVAIPRGFALAGLLQFLMVIGTLIGFLMMLFVIVGMVWFTVLSFQSANMVNWARRNIITERERDARREQRWRERADEMVESSKITDPNAFVRPGEDIGPTPRQGGDPAGTGAALAGLPRVRGQRPESPMATNASRPADGSPGLPAPPETSPAASAKVSAPANPARVPPPVSMESDRADLNPYGLADDD